MMINLLTVCTDAYPIEYAIKTVRQFRKLSKLEDVSAYCITDRRQELLDTQDPDGKDSIVPIDAHKGTKGWWNKLQCYSPEMPEGWNVYLDLDIVMIKNFDEEIRYAIGQDKTIACVSDAIMWKNNKFSSSMQVFKTGRMNHIYDKFDRDAMRIQNFDGGDQVWTGQHLLDKDVLYLDEKYPNLKKNLKFHLGKKLFGQWQFPERISPKIKTVDCGGRPKPHELKLDYIMNNWHRV